MTAEPAAAVHRAVVLPVSREQAWEAVTDPAQLARWLADDVELEARAGGAARFAWEDGTVRVGVVEEVAEQRRISFRWRAEDDGTGARVAAGPGDRPDEESLVELVLDDVEGGTRVAVFEVRIDLLRTGEVPLRPAGGPTAWAPRMAALSAGCAVCRA